MIAPAIPTFNDSNLLFISILHNESHASRISSLTPFASFPKTIAYFSIPFSFDKDELVFNDVPMTCMFLSFKTF